MAQVDFEGVEKRYPGGVQALVDCTLRVADGELLVLVGPSGCGKSTLLRLLAGLEPVAAGTIRIGGRVVNELSPQERNVAMVFQDYALYPHMTVRRNLAFPLRMRANGGSERERRVAWAATCSGSAPLLDRRPRSSPAGSASASPWGAPWCASPPPSCSTSRSPTSTPCCAARCAPRSSDLQRRTGTPCSTSPTTRWRR
jgi:multiple sugar transport system ATP-binding protein